MNTNSTQSITDTVNGNMIIVYQLLNHSDLIALCSAMTTAAHSLKSVNHTALEIALLDPQIDRLNYRVLKSTISWIYANTNITRFNLVIYSNTIPIDAIPFMENFDGVKFHESIKNITPTTTLPPYLILNRVADARILFNAADSIKAKQFRFTHSHRLGIPPTLNDLCALLKRNEHEPFDTDDAVRLDTTELRNLGVLRDV
jgi:hypothetical protein